MAGTKDAAPVEAQAKEAEAEAQAAEGAADKAGEAAASEAEAVGTDAEAPGEDGGEDEDGPGDPLAAAQAEIAELKDRLLRAMAETENVRRRGEREREQATSYAISNFARDLVGVADNLRRAIATVPVEARDDNEALTSLLDGVELTERELIATFERHGIRPIDPMGEKFDHNWHHAVAELEDPSTPAGTIVQVMQTGYAIADRLLRPAIVGVAKGGRDEDDKGHSVDTTV